GSERQALQLTRLLHRSSRFDVRLATLNPEGVLRAEIEDLQVGDIPAFPLTAFYNVNAFRQMRRFTRYLRENNVRVLHTHDFYTNVFGMFTGARARVPVRIASMRETGGMRTAAQLRLQRMSYSLAHQVVANSESVRQELIRQGVGANKTAVIYNGIDLERVKADDTSRARSFSRVGLSEALSEGRLCVTLVANMRHEVKDYPLFLRAARRVHASLPNTIFL